MALALGGTAHAADAAATAVPAAAPAAAEPAEDAAIVVFGRGQTRQVQELQKADIAASVPGTSPLKVLDKLPSVSFQSASPLGTNEWSTKISVRGFQQNQLGFTFDGVPLGDMSYGNFNGLHISRAVSAENLSRTELSQGAGALSTASSSNLGGTIQFFSMDPGDEFAVDTEGTYGSNNNVRFFGRVETGDLGDGIKAYVSGSYLDAPKWKGEGKQLGFQINSKLVVPLGPDGKIAAFVNYSNEKDDDYMDMSPSLIKKYGYNWDYIRNDYATALAIAKNLQLDETNYTHYCENYSGYSQTICADDTYYDGYGLRKDLLAGANINYNFTDNLSLKLTPYYHHDKGLGTWWTPYTPTPGGAALSVRSTTYAIERAGVTGSLTYKIANHTLEAGGWYEHNNYETARDFFPLGDESYSTIQSLQWPSNPFYVQYDYKFKINTYQYFIQDTWQINDALKVTGGFKGLQVNVNNSFVQGDASRNTAGSLRSKDMFIPQIGANYQLSHEFELFASYAENMRAFTTDPFLTTGAAFNTLKGGLKPETSWTAEGGVRFHLPHFEGSLAGYHVKFSNRLLAVQPCAIIVGCATVLSNVGSVTTNGAEVAATYHFTRALSLYGSYAYTNAQYDQDVLSGTVYATKGKQTVDTPKHLINGELAYDDGMFIGRIHANYQSKRYYSYTDDASVGGRVLVDLTAGYRFKNDGFLNGTELQVNVTNLFDKKYVATLGENGFTFSDTTGSLQSMLVGPPRQVFVTLKKRW